MSRNPCACGGKHVKALEWVPVGNNSFGVIEIADGGLFQYELVEASAKGTHDVRFWSHGREQHSQPATGHLSTALAKHWAQKHHESKINKFLEG